MPTLSITKVIALAVVIICYGVACNSGPQPTDGHARMVDMLDSLIQAIDPVTNQYANTARVAYFKNRKPDPKPSKRANQKALLAYELLNSGDSEGAAKLFNEVLEDLKKAKVDNPEYENMINSMMGISWLRVAEQDNCLENHSDESCIYPITNKAVHHIPKGAEAAIEVYSKMLDIEPEDYESKWLLNLCYMILGKFPEGVPAKYRLPNSIFEEKTTIAPFDNIAEKVGLDHISLSGGSIMEDFNGDGWYDIMCTSWGQSDQTVVFLNDGTGQYIDYTKAAGVEGIKGGLNSIAGDYNNDGIIDVFITRGGWRDKAGELPNSLLKGNGDGTFVDVTIEANLLSFNPTQTMSWSDFNNDGWLDIFIGNESKDGRFYPCELFINNQDGTFKESAQSLKANVIGFVKGVVSDDFDNDGRMDLYISCYGEPNVLLRNRRSNNDLGFVFDDWSRKSKVEEPSFSFPTWSFDYDNDGDADLFVATYDLREGDNVKELLDIKTNSDKCKLYRNAGDGTFEDVTAEMGMDKVMLAMGSNYGDLNNDGFLDMYIGTGHPDFRLLMPNRAFLNIGGERFEEVTNSSRLGHLQKGHAVSFGDVDRDGDQDIYTVMGGAFEGDVFQNAMFINNSEVGNFISVRLRGEQSNALAIGSKLIFHLNDGKKIYRTIASGGSFGCSTFELNVSLPGELDHLEIKWAGSSESVSYQIEINKRYLIKEGETKCIEL